MSDRKNYNSIVFLTTLSVYLGLVLVGATPVLAQAALTRNFDIKNEIVVEDDLDKKPDDGEIEEFQKLDIALALTTFVDDLQKLAKIQKYNPKSDNPFFLESEFFLPKDTPNNLFYFPDSIIGVDSSWLKTAINEAFGEINDEKFREIIDFLPDEKSGKIAKRYTLELRVEESGVELNISFKKSSASRASLLSENLNKAFAFNIRESKEKTVKVIYENTKATSENNQIFIVTRLPRGSIDSLPADEDAR